MDKGDKENTKGQERGKNVKEITRNKIELCEEMDE
jgi:hypothetical protein